MKTAIFGGTFNPPHLGHERMIEILSDIREIDEILLIPTGEPVHKLGDTTSAEHRLNMCKILEKKYNKVKVSDMEIKRREQSFTYYTLKDFAKTHSEKPIFVLGGDMLMTLRTWYKYRELLTLCSLFAFGREGLTKSEMLSEAEKIKNDGGDITLSYEIIPGFSSTDVRLGGKNYVSPEIGEYIEKNGLYKERDGMKTEEYKAHIKARLSDRRYFHSLCVAEEAVRLCNRYGGDKEKAYTAGLLHDVLKDTSEKEQLKYREDFGIMMSDLELSAKKLYHSLIGAEYVRHILGVEDDEIISAIRCHTTAKADMTLLEKILYLADYTSRDRDYDGVEEMREAVEESIESAMKIALRFTVEDLKNKGVPCHPDTLAAYEQYAR